LFFDGTGNNRFEDDAKQCWSNVARLFFTARDESQLGIYRIYLSGVGTPYTGRASWAERLDVWIEDNVLGGATGAGGERRLHSGDDQMSAALERALLNNAKTEGGKTKRIAERMEGEGFEKMLASLANHRLIKSISFSIFGFSRGAALARAFANRLADQLKPAAGNQYTYQGVPARIAFLGIFDTVASFGLPGTNWGLWTKKELSIPPVIEKCFHFTAAHELRFSFPLDLIRNNHAYQSNMVEQVYPGVHSDVGGGYEPGKQGRRDTLPRVPLQHMLRAAIEHGVRLHSLDYLRKNRKVIATRLDSDEQTNLAYARYLRACTSTSGTIETQTRGHMELYFSYRGTMHRRKTGSSAANERKLAALRGQIVKARSAESQANSDKWHEFMAGTVPSWWNARKKEGQLEDRIDALEAEREAAEKDAQRLAASDSAIAIQAYALQRALEMKQDLVLKDGQLVWVLEKHPWMLQAWQREASAEVIHFFDNYIHDSRTDFMGGMEPFVYFRNRGMFEQNRKTA
jgi:hypothetical protein